MDSPAAFTCKTGRKNREEEEEGEDCADTCSQCSSITSRKSKKNVNKRSVLPRTMQPLIVCFLLQFLLTFAQGQGHGGEQAGAMPIDQRLYFEVHEGEPSGTLVGTIEMQDDLTYKFSTEPAEFVLDAQTGEIRTSMVIDRESLPEDSFDLTVTSNPARHLIEVAIKILDLNDNYPTFGMSAISINFSENDQPGTQVILDTATDKDIAQNDVTNVYKIISGNTDGKFRLVLLEDTSIPLLYLENTVILDREEKDFYQLNISAQDGGNPVHYGYLLVNITIRDFNDNPPVFDQSDYTASVNETTPVGTSIIQVRATDRDTGNNADITYKILDDDINQFSIDPKTGVVRTLKKLDCQRQCDDSSERCQVKTCFIKVEASDNGQPAPQQDKAYITVTLIDENDHDPQISFQYFPANAQYAMVDESASLNHLVAIVTVSDADDGTNGEGDVEIVKGNELGHFSINPQFTVFSINVAGRIDREVISKYNLTIVARDRGVPSRSSTAFLIIMVNDINDHEPKFQQSQYQAQLSELVPVGSFVAGMTATDNDTGINAQITYQILTGNDLGWFRIDPQTGLVMTAVPLDREVQNVVRLSVRAQDGAAKPAYSLANLTVTIWDENDQVPTFSQGSYDLDLVEGPAIGVEILAEVAEDQDQGKNGSIRYSMSPDVETNYPGMFQLNPLSGRITTLRALDREEYARMELRLLAVDQGTPALTGSTVIRVKIGDVNDNNPVFYPIKYYGAVQESDPVQTSVIQVKATDLDSGNHGEVRYSIMQGSDQRFTIDETSGWIVTTRRLDKSIKSIYRLTVNARDLGNKYAPDTADIEINVMDGTEAIPSFSQTGDYLFSISEDSSKGSPSIGRRVGQVQATVPGRSVVYSILDGDSEGLFSINRNSGYITTTAAVDREYRGYYSLEVVASASGVFSMTRVNVSVADINDNAPSFGRSSASGEIPENLPIGQDVFLAQALDPDSGDNAKLQYTLESRPMFRIDADTGMVVLAQPLSQTSDTQFSMVVTAKDSGSPQYSAQLSVAITIQDVNDHTPLFQQSGYEVTIEESQPINDLFFRVTAEDDDVGRNAEVFYEIVKGNVGNRFGIFPDGQLYVAHALDRETHDLYVLTVKAFDMGLESRSSLTNVTIHILDDNDNAPIFSNTTYEMDIEERADIGNYVGTVYASDRDTGLNAELFYSFEGPHDGFEIHAKTGVIINSLSFDREEQVAISKVDFVTLSVVVNDNGSPQRSDKATVKVLILDTNDNAPEFLHRVYTPSVFENAEEDTEVVRVHAEDLDTGENARVLYSIFSGNEGDRFKIDSLNGKIVVNKGRLDRETKDSYLLVVMATDNGYPALNTTCEVHVTVLDYNDNAPEFIGMNQEYSISENAVPGEVITQVTAQDPDLGNKALVSYGIVNNVSPVFTIDSQTGKLSLASILDYETKSSYTLNVSATDNGTPSLSGYIVLTVNVIDYNDNAPRFSDTPVIRQIEEGIMVGSPVTTVTANDPDSGINGRLRYSISQQVPAGQNFTIDSVSGEIRTGSVIDREAASNFKLTILAVDQALPLDTRKSAEKMVTIVIEDVNDNSPRFVSQSAADVLLGAQPNTQIIQVRAEDPDEGRNGLVTYEISSGDRQIFSIEESTGNLYLRSSLSPQILSYDLTIVARDGGSNPRSSYTSINVFVRSNIENGPSFSQTSYYGEVSENEPVGTSILTVNAGYDSGSNARVEYMITSVKSKKDDGPSVDQTRYFYVNPLSGQITTTQPLDRELGYELFNVMVYAIEKGSTVPRTRSTMVQIRLLDVLDSPPVFLLEEDVVEVAEDVLPGEVVTRIAVSDADLQGGAKFTLTDGGLGHFAIDITTGEITVVRTLDRESQAEYALRVMANDGALTSTATVTVRLTDVNDQPPNFSQQWYSFTVPESTQTGLSIGQVRATDADSGDNAHVTYSITSHWGRDKFSLDPNSGVLRLIGNLDYEQHEHYVLTVRAQDSGAPPLSSTATLYVNVLDDNNHAPVFDVSSYRADVREDAVVGTTVLAVTATDSDAGDNSIVRYSIVGGDPSRLFTIDEVTGEVKVGRTLDREDQGYYNLAIQAQDQAASNRASSTAMVTVDLLDANDNAPEFQSPKQITVPENSPTGASVAKIIATDADAGDNGKIQYELLHDLGNMFVLGANDGVLRVSRELDREAVDEYSLTVRASDKGTPKQSTDFLLTVKVGDENDHEPVFDPRTYQTEQAENVAVGTYLLSLEATDDDIGLNAELRYSIVSGDENHDFYINPKTGDLSVKKRLDYERRQEYTLDVQVHDLGNPQHSDSATVSIKLRDINDCAPTFHDAPYVAFVHENVVDLPVHVLRVTARDDDTGSGGEVAYSITEGDRSSFRIDSATGEITATRTLDREETSEYTLVVQAMDKGLPRLLGVATVTVMVGDANDNAPTFRHAHYNGRVRENVSVGSPAAQVQAEDADAGNNAQIRYSLLDDAHGKFQIHPSSGLISTAMVLDRESGASSYRLVAMATDQASLPLSSTTVVMVMVEDDNDNEPQFLQSQYTQYLRDPTSAGWFVAGVTAVDADTGTNGEIEYQIVDASVRTALSIDSVTGVITAKATLTDATVPTRSFYVRAVDKGSPSRSSDVLVSLNFLSSSATTFPQFLPMQETFRLSENLNTGYVVVTATGRSNRPGASLSYLIAGGNQENTFEMNGGQLRVKQKLDFERVESYRLWLAVRDSSSEPPLEDHIELAIAVSDENDCIPVFDGLYHNASVAENQFQAVQVITVTASDCDSGDNGRITYALALDGNIEDAFTVDANTGQIRTQRELDREEHDRYLLVMTATDHGSPTRNTATATVDITVLDRNDRRPIFTTHFNTRIPENAANGTFVLKITSTDGDIGDNAVHIYTLTGNPDGKFAINPRSGNITVAGPLDRESRDEYILQLAANDGSYNAETSVSIYVLDVNDNAPKFQQGSYDFMLAELQPPNTPVGKVSASDLDANGPNSDIYYRFEPASGEFEIDAATGVISAHKMFEFMPDGDEASPENVHQLTVVASDRGEPAMVTRTTVTITVQQANRNAPVFDSAQYTAAVSEDAMIGSSVVMVTASDIGTGLNALLTYTVEAGNGSSLFQVDPDSGIISVAQTIQNLETRTYYIKIQATDHGRPPKSAVTNVYIKIALVNNFQPEFTSSSDKFRVELPENYQLGEVVSKVTAIDRDVGVNGIIRYFITGGDTLGKFEIDQTQGFVRVAKALDYETQKVHYLNITARDSGLIPKEKTRLMTVFVTDVNDSPPVFSLVKYDAYVKENSPRDTSVFRVEATDADSTSVGSIAYYITGDALAVDAFSINPMTGLIRLTGDINYETMSDYTIEIKAINPGSTLSGTTVIHVHVTGENEFTPTFLEREYSFEVSESAEMGQSIGKIRAVDRDQGPEGIVFYYLVGDSNMEGFVIDAETGDVRISRPIDRESTSEIRLNVLAKNSGPIFGNDTDLCVVRIVVGDANDPPRFAKKTYEGEVSEGADIGASVIVVTAIDNDEKVEDRTFTYSLLLGNVGNAFRITERTGQITSNRILDREAIGVYNLTVAAVDTGMPPQTGTTLVKVFVTDINDNGPHFVPNIPVGAILENQVPMTVSGLNLVQYTHDRDLDPNQEPYRYRLVDHTDIFEVGITNGYIRAKVQLDRESSPEYSVKVEVGDNGNPVMTSTLTFSIDVLDENDNPSSPRPLDLNVFAFDNKFTGYKIGTVEPNDIDTVGDYRCQVTGGDLAQFSIRSACDLYANKVGTSRSFDVDISGSDGIHESVDYSVNIAFNSFNQSEVGPYQTTIVKLGQVTTSEFLRSSYKRFVSAVRASLPTGSEVILYNMREQTQADSSTSVILLLAARTSNNKYMTRNQLAQKITDAKSSIENSAGVNIAVISYSPCQDTICANGAECTYTLDTQAGEYSYHTSSALSFTSPKILLSTMCNCREGFQGSNCEVPVSKCRQQPCQNGATCRDRTSDPGYECQCQPEYQGVHCEIHIDVCESNPCKNGGECLVKDLGYVCQCSFAYFGDHCDISAMNFGPLSFMEYDMRLDQQQNQIHLEVATIQSRALLFYAPVDKTEYMALEINEGQVEFSFSLGSNATRLRVPRLVSDGAWYRIEAERTRNVGTLRVMPCAGDGMQQQCERCSDNDPKCFAQASHGNFENLDAVGSFYIGGVPDISLLLERPGRVSSASLGGGCMRHLVVDSVDLLQGTLDPVSQQGTGPCQRSAGGVCSVETCQENEVDSKAECRDEWEQAWCECPPGTAGDTCQLGSSFSLGSDAMVKFTLKPSVQQQEQLSAASSSQSRKRRSLPQQRSVSIKVRSVSDRAVLLYSQLEDGDYTLIYLDNKQVHYASQSGGSVLSHDQEVSDGQWHTISLTVADDTATLSVNDSPKSKTFDTRLPDPVGKTMTSMTLGSPEETVTIPGSGEELKGLSGCVDDFRIDDESVPLGGSTERYSIEVSGDVSATCDAFLALSGVDAEGPPVVIVVSVIISFFVLVCVVILVSCLVIRYRRREKQKRGYPQHNGNGKLNGSVDKSDGRSSHHDSGFTEGGGIGVGGGGGVDDGFNEEQIIRHHIAAELQQHVYQEREVAGERRPDIIGQEACSPAAPTPQPGGGGMDNIGFHQEEPAEHYDIDNASSIAPSDLVDVVAHYKRYRSGLHNNQHAYAPPPPQPNSRHHHYQHRPSPNHLLLTQRNHSPASLSSQSRTSPNILAGQPSAKSPLTINNIQHYNQLQQQHRHTPTQQLARGTSPLPRGVSPSVGAAGKRGPSPSLRSTPLSGISALYQSNLSDSSLSTAAPPPPRPNSKLKQPISALGLPRGGTPVQGLTVEEVNRLNARHKLSPVSTVDVVSTSSEDNGENNINRTDFSHSDLIDAAPQSGLMSPPPPQQSSSEDDNGTNDSFTCSEVDYDDSKPRYDALGAGGLAGRGGLYPVPGRLARVDEIDTDTTMSRRTITTHDTDSISTFFTSDDEPSATSHRLQRSKLPNGALNWDYLLNWGPNFEKLVGVFADIAQLPDSDTDNSQRKGRLSLSKAKSPPPRPPKNGRSPAPTTSPLPHIFSNGLSSSPANMSQSPLNIPHSPKSRSPITPSSSTSPPPYVPPPLAHSNHLKSTIPVGSVPPHPRSPHPKSPIPLNQSPSPTVTNKTPMQNGSDTVNESYLEEYV